MTATPLVTKSALVLWSVDLGHLMGMKRQLIMGVLRDTVMGFPRSVSGVNVNRGARKIRQMMEECMPNLRRNGMAPLNSQI